MPKKKKWQARVPTWTPLVKATLAPAELAQAQQHFGLSAEEVAQFASGEFWRNDRYQVCKRLLPGEPPWVWLSIHRVNREASRDWREFQYIKNQLLGEECEAVELYPAESRLVDTSNEYHLVGSSDPTFRFPFGFRERLVLAHPGGKAKQRPFAQNGTKPL